MGPAETPRSTQPMLWPSGNATQHAPQRLLVSQSQMATFADSKQKCAAAERERRAFKETSMSVRKQFFLFVLPGLGLLLLTASHAQQVDGRRPKSASGAAGLELAQVGQKPKIAAAGASHQQDEKAIRANVDAMTKAFNDKDAA